MDKDSLIERLQKQIADFKEYDRRRKESYHAIIAERDAMAEKLEQARHEVDVLQFRIDALIDCYDTANGLIDNRDNKAYVKKLLDKLEKRPMTTAFLSELDNQLADEIVALRKGMATVAETNRELKQENIALKKLLNYDMD